MEDGSAKPVEKVDKKEEKKSASPTKKSPSKKPEGEKKKKEAKPKDPKNKEESKGKDAKGKDDAKGKSKKDDGKGKPKKDDGKVTMGGANKETKVVAKAEIMDVEATKKIVWEFMLKNNRPYSVQDILNFYQVSMRRKNCEASLDLLVEEKLVTLKEYGKAKVYLVN